MPRIAVLSDTHDRLPESVVMALRGADEIWHLGDVCSPAILLTLEAVGCPIRVVRGNCDSEATWPLELRLEVAGFHILLVHIPPGMPPADAPDLLLHGHTHVPRDETIRGVRFLNPGCISRPKGAPESFAWLTLEQGRAALWKTVPLRR